MKELPRAAQVYIFLILTLGLAVVAASIPALVAQPSLLPTTIALIAINAILDLFPVRLFLAQSRNSVEISVSTAVKLASIFIVPFPVVVLSCFGSVLISELLFRRVWYRLAFNVGALTVYGALITVIFSFLYDPGTPLFGSLQNILAVIALGLSAVLINEFLVSMVISLATKSALDYVWKQTYRSAFVHDLSMLPLGIFIYILWQYAPWSVILAVLPLFITRYSYQLVFDMQRQTREALHALARVMDERDEHTSEHSDNVANIAGMIARELGMGPAQVDVVMRAAALHDIGKIGMRNDILFKPGALAPEERESAKRHAAIGGDLLKKFPLFEVGADYVRHHHERWDGKGYPDGLAGEAIPLGARIVSVADSFQAMVEVRPYRKPLTEHQALNELRACAGTQFDPKVVEAFFRVKGYSTTTVERVSLATSDEMAVT